MSAVEILRHAGLSITVQRLMVLQLFMHTAAPVKYSVILSSLSHSIHRGTLYRIVRMFVKKQLLHLVPNREGVLQYKLSYTREEGKEQHQLLFACDGCGETFILDHCSIPAVDLPRGFEQTAAQLVIKGKCVSCTAVADPGKQLR